MAASLHWAQAWDGTEKWNSKWTVGGSPFALGAVTLGLQGKVGFLNQVVTLFDTVHEFTIDDRHQLGLVGQLGIRGNLNFGVPIGAAPFSFTVSAPMGLQGRIGIVGDIAFHIPVLFALGSATLALQGRVGMTAGVHAKGDFSLSAGTPTRFRRNDRR